MSRIPDPFPDVELLRSPPPLPMAAPRGPESFAVHPLIRRAGRSKRRSIADRVVGYCRCSSVGLAMVLLALLGGSGCKASVSEVRGKTAFGPEFRNRGNNTSEVRYDVRQNVDLKWSNGWSSGLTYRRRDVDDGSGDNENLFLFDVGYPIWKAPKKPEKSSERIEELEEQVREMRARVAALTEPAGAQGDQRIAHAGDSVNQEKEE